MHKIIAFIFVVLLGSYEPPASNTPPKPPAIAAKPADPQSDGSYEHFMDSALSRKEIIYDSIAVTAKESWLWSDQEGSYPEKPKKYLLGKTSFSMMPASMQVVNEAGDRLYSVRYETDTAFIFHFKGQKYGWAQAHFYMCNGSGCLEQYYLLADFQRMRLHVFTTMAVPTYDLYFGDLNGDDDLDFLIPDYISKPHSKLPYSDTTEMMRLTPYTLNKNGMVDTLQSGNVDRSLIGVFDNGNFAPANFRIYTGINSFGR